MKNFKQKYLKYANKKKQIGGGLCVVCGKIANIVFMPCKHNVYCNVCLEGMKRVVRENVEKNLCPFRCANSTKYYLINDDKAIANIENNTFLLSPEILAKESNIDDSTLETFVLSMLSAEIIVNMATSEILNKILEYIATLPAWREFTFPNGNGMNDFKQYITLVIEREKARDSYTNVPNETNETNEIDKEKIMLINKEKIMLINSQLNNIDSFVKSLNFDFSKFNVDKKINPQMLIEKDTIDALNIQIDDIVADSLNRDTDKILKIFENRPDSRSLDLSDEEGILETKLILEEVMHYIEDYYWMYYQREYASLFRRRFPILNYVKLSRMIYCVKYFTNKYFHNRINREQNPSIKNNISEMFENFQALSSANDSLLYGTDAPRMYNFMQELYYIINQIPL